MCILFLHVNPRPSPGQFRLILAANRDEYYKRAAVPTHHWEEDPNVIGGRDMEPGKEGGSWLALSSRGRIAALLNIMGPGEHPPHLLGRGSLVADFVKGSTGGHEFLNKIAVDSHKFRPFNFLTIQMTPEKVDVCEYSNVGDDPKPVIVDRPFVGISNSLLDQPFAKVTAGTDQFRDIVKRLGTVESREALQDQLVTFLKQEDRHFPDPELTSRGPKAAASELQLLSSVYVNVRSRGYGTRAHSIILVDADGRADFSEWAMKEPIDPETPDWGYNHFTCQLQL